MIIESLNNPKIIEYKKLHQKKYRDLKNMFLVENNHLIQEADKTNLIIEILHLSDTKKYDKYNKSCLVNQKILDNLSLLNSDAEAIAVCKYIENSYYDNSSVLILENIQDPSNLGAILRNALSFNFRNIYLSNDSVDVYNEKVIRSSQGALFHLNITRCDINKEIMKIKKNYRIYATNSSSKNKLNDITFESNIALVFGNEGKGITSKIRTLCDDDFWIEMENFDSLNVASSSAICMYKHYVK